MLIIIICSTEGNMGLENKDDVEDIIDSPDSPTESRQTTSSVATKLKPKQNKQKLSIFQESLLNIIEKNQTQMKPDEFDDNKHFLLSLLPSMKKMDSEKNFQFRIEVMEAMKKYMTPSSQPQTSYSASYPPTAIMQSRNYYQVMNELYPLSNYQYHNVIQPRLDISQSSYLNVSTPPSAVQNVDDSNNHQK